MIIIITKQLANKYKQYVIDMRREFHMYPEVSLQEFRTSQRIKEELDKMGIPYTASAGTGVIAVIEGSRQGRTVGLRADIDALQVQELNDVPYKSKNEGVMHACGHDGHAAMLLGAAKILNEMKGEIKGTVKLFFQPAEELAVGAKKMIEEGAMEGVDGTFAIHLMADVPCGKITLEEGPRLASADIFKITVEGKGGHGSMPHQGIDVVVAGSAIIMQLQSIVSREVSPLQPVTLSIGSFHTGTRFNVIASEGVMEGTTRCFDPKIREELPKMIQRVIENTASSYRAKAKLEYILGTPPTINHKESSDIGQKSIEKLFGRDAMVPYEKLMGGEDYSMFLEKAQGAIAFVGIGNEAKETCYSHHHGRFNMDEDALELGTALYAQYALDFLNKFN